MIKARILFEKKVYAYLDVEEDSLETIEKKCGEDDYFGMDWKSDSFMFPDSDWKIVEVETFDRLNDLWEKAKNRYIDNTDHDAVIEMLDKEEKQEYWELYEGEKLCIYGCGKVLDPDYDYENSCKKCE